MSPEEQHDLDLAKAKVSSIQKSCFDLLREYLRMDATALAHCGHRNGVGPALESAVKSALKEIDSVWKVHTTKYPD